MGTRGIIFHYVVNRESRPKDMPPRTRPRDAKQHLNGLAFAGVTIV
jgi:hypothetical protein